MSQCCGEIVYEGLCVRGRPAKVLDCIACGFRHLHPKPTEEEMVAYYRDLYFSGEKPNYAATSGTESEYQFLVDEEKITAAWPNLSSPVLPPRVLDFGCGPSAPFLKHMARLVGCKNFLAYGMEPTQADKVRSIGLEGGTALGFKSLDQLDDGPHDKFDIIHLGFVLEHVVNPFKILLDLKKRLAPGGRLIVEVPNDWNPLQVAIWRKGGGVPWWVSSPDHQGYYDFKSLSGVLSRVGFSVSNFGTTYPVETFLAHGLDFRKDEDAKKKAVVLRADLQRLWKDWGDPQARVGRTVWVVAEVKNASV